MGVIEVPTTDKYIQLTRTELNCEATGQVTDIFKSPSGKITRKLWYEIRNALLEGRPDSSHVRPAALAAVAVMSPAERMTISGRRV